jgi:hypothetical protein
VVPLTGPLCLGTAPGSNRAWRLSNGFTTAWAASDTGYRRMVGLFGVGAAVVLTVAGSGDPRQFVL